LGQVWILYQIVFSKHTGLNTDSDVFLALQILKKKTFTLHSSSTILLAYVWHGPVDHIGQQTSVGLNEIQTFIYKV